MSEKLIAATEKTRAFRTAFQPTGKRKFILFRTKNAEQSIPMKSGH
jgi:hypothetical protein